jgi:hypothetical protein
MTTEWVATASALPDDEQTVLIALSDDEVWTGFHDGDDGWRYVSADPVGVAVTHWMPFPEPPA